MAQSADESINIHDDQPRNKSGIFRVSFEISLTEDVRQIQQEIVDSGFVGTIYR